MAPSRARPLRGPVDIDHSMFHQVKRLEYEQILGPDELQFIREHHATQTPLVLSCKASACQQAECLASWTSFVADSSPSITYSTQEHGNLSLRKIWHSRLGVRMETSLRGEAETNAVRDWLETSTPGSFVHQLHTVQKQLETLATEFKSRRSTTVLYPSFVTGLVEEGGGTTHFDSYTNLAFVTVGCKTFYSSRSFDESPINQATLRGKDNERRGVNPYNSASLLPRVARLDAVPQELWSAAVLRAGDILYLPLGYWHWVHSTPHAVMTNVWTY